MRREASTLVEGGERRDGTRSLLCCIGTCLLACALCRVIVVFDSFLQVVR